MYREICETLGVKIPKGTMSLWCKGIVPPEAIQATYREKNLLRLAEARKIALEVNKHRREKWLSDIREANLPLLEVLDDVRIAKIALAMLYLGEGYKTRRGALAFGNSNSGIIRLFLQLLRRCYQVDDKKFRCTVQCRADQDVNALEKHWREVTAIPRECFYGARIDKRTTGKPTLKANYKGVCVIDYFSSQVFNDILIIGKLLCEGR